MKNWQSKVPPYTGSEPYLYFAFAQADSAKVWKILRPLLERGCRVWYSCGPAGSSEELLRRQERSSGAAMTVIYLSDAARADKDTKSSILVNQKLEQPILVLDPDGADRRLSMGLREDLPHVALYELHSAEETESAIIHAEGFTQDVIGEPITVSGESIVGKLSAALLALGVLLLAVSFVGLRYFHWFQPDVRAEDEVVFSDPAILSAVREAARGGAITEELAESVTVLRLDAVPESWEELSLLPALERVELPQQALLEGQALPDGDYQIELRGGAQA